MTENAGHTPKISVVIPACNAERHVEKAIKSALEQRDVPLEVILVDDASKDATLKIATQIKDSRLRIFRNPENRGPSYSRNLAIDRARGEWIALLDADDFFKRGRLRMMLIAAEAEKADLVADNLAIVSDAGEFLCQACYDFHGKSMRLVSLYKFLDMNRPLASGVKLGYAKPLMRVDFLRRNKLQYDEKVWVAEDFLFYATAISKGARFLLLSQAMYCYRLADGSVTRNSRGTWRARQQLEANRTLIKNVKDTSDARLKRLLARRDVELQAQLVYIELKTLAKSGKWPQFIAKAFSRFALLPGVARAFGRAVRRRWLVSRGNPSSFHGLRSGKAAGWVKKSTAVYRKEGTN